MKKVDKLTEVIEVVKGLEIIEGGLEVNWIESSDEWVINYGDVIIMDGMSEKEANRNYDKLSAYEIKIAQIDLKEYDYEYSMENNKGESFTEIALERMVIDSWDSEFETVAFEVADGATPIANYEIWEVASNNYESIEENIEEGLIIIDGELTRNFMSSIAYTLNRAIEVNKNEVLYNYIAYRVNKMLLDKHATQMDIEGLEQEIENYADEAENSYNEFSYIDDEMFSQLEEFIDSYIAGLSMGESLNNQDYENIGDVTVTEGAMFIKKDEDTDKSYYVVRVCGNEFDGFHVENMYVDLNDGWIDWYAINDYAGIDMDADDYERVNALISYDGIDNFNPTVTDCKTPIDLCGALREHGVNVVWSAEHNEIQF
ncbi:hypothetical protein SALINJAH_259 [Bacillus phage SalinJah]|uniref:Uncharacterized protein n=1 Tax=Bacillus phage SalinJah TaxID=1837830 RepID=A0A173GC82_9CAUD|nr:hypothetical protein SALINJAH_259 [Bacillus phage SalinJah]ANH50815.1 hypothetical protein SALINJAH_259 [Bacillus phage SalinJah]